ncbi:MAG: hypothetical protein MHM6MM_003111 [Cercozoa sp. M6MM]
MAVAKKQTSVPKYIDMVVMAIKDARDFTRGASRAKIASWIKTNYPKCDNAAFNAALRNALSKGLETGVLAQGETPRRFKHVPAALKEAEKKKKMVAKKAVKKEAAKKTPKKKTPAKKAAKTGKKTAKKVTKKPAKKGKNPAKKAAKKPTKKAAKKATKKASK